MSSLMSIMRSATSGMSELTAKQRDFIRLAPEDQHQFLEAQMKMQKEQQITQLITQMIKAMHEMAMGTIKNIGT